MKDIDERVRELLNSPVGCAFLLLADVSGLLPREIAEPANSLYLGAYASDEMEVWRANHDWMPNEVLERGQRFKDLARALLKDQATSWWFAPLDRDHQVCVPRYGTPPDPTGLESAQNPPSGFERYAQKVKGTLHTSTLIHGTSSMFEALAQGTCDIPGLVSYPGPPWMSWKLQIPASARVFEIDGPLAWHNLCLFYPAEGRSDRNTPDFSGNPCRIVPDWSAFAADWDAVHLTFGGLLTAEQVRIESPSGWTYLWGWDAEQTMWLRWLFPTSERLAGHEPRSSGAAKPPIDLLLR